MPSAIKPLRHDWRLAATAFVVVWPACDNLWLHRAIYAAPKGAVLVHACGADEKAGCWDGTMAHAARARGLAGFVTEGGVRDSEELRKLDWSVFTANVCIQGTSKRPDGAGPIGRAVVMGAVLVHTGDLPVADADGVVVIPGADAQKVIISETQRENDELAIVERLAKGERTLNIYQLPPQV